MQSRVQRAPAKKLQSVSHKLRCLAQRNKRLVSRISSLHADIQKMQTFNATLSEEVINERVSKLPQKQQECVKQCLAAAQVKEKGIRYTKMWILECIMMKMKSSRLYDHIRDNKILALPSKTTLKRYMSVYRSAFGFSKKVLEELKLKTQTMDHFKKHGGLLVDELKLSEHLCVKSTGHIEGFVDLGDYTTKADKGVQSDHGMVILFVPFVGKWSQVIGTFATRGNVKGDLLARVLIEAIILAESSGLFVDFLTCDGATWNRSMWKVLGISGKAGHVKCKVEHPVDGSRSLHFVSDFPHLIKCVRNGLVKCPFNTPDGHVSFFFFYSVAIKLLFQVCECSLTLRNNF